MIRKLRLMGVLAGGLYISAGAAAQELPPLFSADVAPWRITGRHQSDGLGICTMHGLNGRGTSLDVMMTADHAPVIRFTLQNHAWASLDPGNDIDMMVKFDGERGWPISGITTDPSKGDYGISFTRPDSVNDSFLTALKSAHSMTVERDGRLIDRFELGGTRAAFAALTTCQAQIGNGPNFDPFVPR